MRNGYNATRLAQLDTNELTTHDLHVLQAIAIAAVNCRNAQTAYFRARNTHNLEVAKRFEGELDTLLDSTPAPQPKQHGLF